jgi:anhydro-N-acetylmuramic acid kinase
MDGIDAALVDFSGLHPRLIDCQTFPYTPKLLDELHRLCAPSENEITLLGQADRAVAQAFSQATISLLVSNDMRPEQIRAIGSHGQTVRHMPEGEHAFSLQIGDPNSISALTSIDVIADFRRKDIALGGQGAPLVPAFHQAVFGSDKQSRVVVNIGGIANITYLPKDKHKPILGYDTGPGNTLLDAWCKKHTGKTYDVNGEWAAQSTADPQLLRTLYSDPYFQLNPPKSTGRELFDLAWLERQLVMSGAKIDPQKVQATLVALTSVSIAQQIHKFDDVEQVYVCGGGAQNAFLMECLKGDLHECELFYTDTLGIGTDAVEAMACAWLAYAHINQISGNIPSVTGASKAAVLGTCCPGSV